MKPRFLSVLTLKTRRCEIMGSLLKQETTSLIHINHNKPFTDSLVIAECVGLTHKRVIRLIRNHQADLEEFGRVGFENSPFMTKAVFSNAK